jgi:hypothetical protein
VTATLKTAWYDGPRRDSCIAIHQENGGAIVEAQKLAGHADLRTQLYNRKLQIERVQL